MYIRRDRSRLRFGGGYPRRSSGPLIGLAAGALIIILAIWQFDRLQTAAVSFLGEPPTPTPPASAVAQEGYAAYVAGDLESAASLYAEALRMEPDSLDILNEYAHTLLLLNRGAEALDAAEHMIALAPGDPRGLALKVYGLYQIDRVDEAIALGRTTLERHPDYAPTYAYLAWAYADIGRWQQAAQMGERAVTLDPDSMDSFRAYAYALTWLGDREGAIRALEAAIALHPTLDFLYFEAAEKYRALENVPAAIAAYERALAIRPTNVRALLRLCQTYLYLREDARAEDYCRRALDIDPTYAAAWQQIGQVYYAESKFQDSIDAYEQCVALEFDSIYCYYQRGLAYVYLRRCDLAVPLLEESMERTQSDRILGFIREGLRMCQVVPPPELIPAESDGSTDGADLGDN